MPKLPRRRLALGVCLVGRAQTWGDPSHDGMTPAAQPNASQITAALERRPGPSATGGT